MKLTEIISMPTTVEEIPLNSSGVHESCVRSYQILEKTKKYLSDGVPLAVILELIDEMEGE